MEAAGVDWARDARRVVAELANESVRATLIDLFEETAAFIEFEQGRSRDEAEQHAFGLVLFHAMRHGVAPEETR